MQPSVLALPLPKQAHRGCEKPSKSVAHVSGLRSCPNILESEVQRDTGPSSFL